MFASYVHHVNSCQLSRLMSVKYYVCFIELYQLYVVMSYVELREFILLCLLRKVLFIMKCYVKYIELCKLYIVMSVMTCSVSYVGLCQM